MDAEFLTNDEIFLHNLRIFVRNKGQRILYYVAKDLYIYHHCSNYGNSTIGEFHTTIPKNISKELKGIEDFKFSNTSSSSEPFIDITKCFAIIDSVLDTKFYIDFEELINNCRNLKNIRNKIHHQYYFEKNELNELKKGLIDSLERICKCINTFFSANSIYFNNANNITLKYETFLQIDFEDIKYTLAESNIEKILNDFAELSLFINNCQGKINDVYRRKLKITSPILNSSSLDLEKVYVPVILECNNKKLVYEDLFLKKNIGKSEPPQFILIIGDAGYGKTTLCKKLTLDMCDIYKNKRRHVKYGFDLVFFIEVKHVTKKGLYNYVKEMLLQDTFINESEKEFDNLLQELNILIIIDAYDEDSFQAKELVEKLLNLQYKMKIVITTRPQFQERIVETLKSKDILYLLVSLKGFEDNMMYVKKIWENVENNDIGRNVENFQEYINGLSFEFRSFIKIPIISYLLVHIWLKCDNIVALISPESLTYTKLYSQVMEVQKETICTKLASLLEKDRTMPDLSSDIKDILITLHKQCFYSFEETPSFSSQVSTSLIEAVKNEIKEKFGSKYIIEILSSMFKVSSSFHTGSDNNSNLSYEFLHKTQYEYFVACHIAYLLKNKSEFKLLQLNLFKENNLLKNIEIFSFLIGILSSEEHKYKPEVKKEVTEITRNIKIDCSLFESLWKILCEVVTDFESKNETSFQKTLCSTFERLLPTECKLADENIISGLKLLYYVNSELKSIKINLDRLDPHDIPFFCEAYSRLMKKFKTEEKTVELSIIFKKHMENTENQKNSDIFLKCLVDPFALNLIQFTGFVGKEGIETLSAFKNLSEIIIRVTCVKALISLCGMLEKRNKIKKIILIFNAPFLEELKRIPNIPLTDISINYMEVKDINMFVNNLEELKPKNKKFQSVSLKLFDYLPELPDKENWLLKMQHIVVKDVFVSSNYDFEDVDDDDEDILCKIKKYNKLKQQLKYHLHFD